jgi:hypothetical protein
MLLVETFYTSFSSLTEPETHHRARVVVVFKKGRQSRTSVFGVVIFGTSERTHESYRVGVGDFETVVF